MTPEKECLDDNACLPLYYAITGCNEPAALVCLELAGLVVPTLASRCGGPCGVALYPLLTICLSWLSRRYSQALMPGSFRHP